MKKRILKSTVLALLFSLIFSINVFAAGLTQDATGIHYLKDDGTFATSTWVEISNLWFLFDANGVLVNPEGALTPNDTDGCYQIITSYTPFVTDDTALLNQCVAAGSVVCINGQYFITPETSTAIRNAALSAASKNTAVEQPVTTETTIVEQPIETTPQYVWLSATGNKYHRINNCGRMNPNRATQVTLEEAQSRGKGKCSNCW